MKRLVILGASGSIGVSTMEVVMSHPNTFCLLGISVGHNINKLKEYLNVMLIENVCVSSYDDYLSLKATYPKINWFYGNEGLIQLVSIDRIDIVVNALVGFVGLAPTLKAIENGCDIGLANKETLVVAGELVLKACQENKVHLLPIDSEHSAIFQCLSNQSKTVNKLFITASGGSFRDLNREDLKNVTKEKALAHPNWKMGAKITIDSATMMNKGFEVIEAHYLFNVAYDDIEVYLHRNSIVHSLVEFCDHSVLAQLGTPDMRIPIQYALTYPKRLEMLFDNRLDLCRLSDLSFEQISYERYPLLKLAYDVGRAKGIMPCVMNAANEIAVSRFISGDIAFLDIERIVFACVENTPNEKALSLSQLQMVDKMTREMAMQL